jgi:hypothetical protein
MRGFRIKPIAGLEDISCDEFDENETEYWFIYYKEARRVFHKCNVISIEGQPPPDPCLRSWFQERAQEVRKMNRSHELDFGA